MISRAIATNQKSRPKKLIRKSLRKRKLSEKTSLTEAVRRLVCALRASSEPVAVFSFCGRISIMKASLLNLPAFVDEKRESLVGVYNREFFISDVIDDFSLFFTDEVSE